jgi:hypothetical protein
MRDAAPGESVLLVNHVHQPASTPYRASHAVFVREHAERAYDSIDEVPRSCGSARSRCGRSTAGHFLARATPTDGRELEREIERMLSELAIAYVHAHYGAPGCYAARIVRA